MGPGILASPAALDHLGATLLCDASAMADAPDQLLLTVSGKDHPGITARLTGVLAHHGAEILDIDQVVLHGRLTLCLRVALPPRHGALRDLLIERSEEHTSELQSRENLVCRLLLEKKKYN